jgi:DNA polymerase-3 subunit delta
LQENKDKNLADYIAKTLDEIPESVLVVFSESGVPDKKSGLFKKLNISKHSEEFKPLEGVKLTLWIKEKTAKLGVAIETAAIEKLKSYIGSDLWRLNNEIEKLALFAAGRNKKEIEAAAIEEMIEADINKTNFDLIDALALKNGQRALLILNNLLKSGSNEVAILGMIVYQYRTMLSIWPYVEKNQPPVEIARQLKIHPFVVSRTSNFLKKTNYEELAGVYNRLAETDIKIKTGQIEASLGLNLLLADICRKW